MSAGALGMKVHLCFRRSYDITFDDRILDVVEDLIGPNILVFASRFWIKKGNDGTYVSWHQDSASFGCAPHAMVTCCGALTPARKEHARMRVMPRSPEIAYDQNESHENAPGDAPGEKKNLLGRGQKIRGLDESKAVFMELEQGQSSWQLTTRAAK